MCWFQRQPQPRPEGLANIAASLAVVMLLISTLSLLSDCLCVTAAAISAKVRGTVARNGCAAAAAGGEQAVAASTSSANHAGDGSTVTVFAVQWSSV